MERSVFHRTIRQLRHRCPRLTASGSDADDGVNILAEIAKRPKRDPADEGKVRLQHFAQEHDRSASIFDLQSATIGVFSANLEFSLQRMERLELVRFGN